jgi:hypothetical protein
MFINKRFTFLVIGIFSSAFFFLYLLVVFAGLPNWNSNGFSRKIIPNAITPLRDVNIDVAGLEICGMTNAGIYLSGNTSAKIFRIDMSLNHYDTIPLRTIDPQKSGPPRSVFVDSPNVFIHLNNYGIIQYGKLGRKMEATKLNTQVFTRSVQLKNGGVVLRGFESGKEEQTFMKYAVDSNINKVVSKSNLLEVPGDMGFGTDGVLKYDPVSNVILYVQYHRNDFYCMDSNLNLLFKAKTIDTISFNPINVVKYSATKDSKVKKILPEFARITVNKDCFIGNGFLFVESGLRSEKESFSFFNKNAVIDAYKLENGNYVGSFYIPLPKGNKKVQSIYVHKGNIVILFDKHLSVYRLSI